MKGFKQCEKNHFYKDNKLFIIKLIDSNDKDVGDEFITGIQYDSKDPDDEEPDFNPKHGYWGPKVY